MRKLFVIMMALCAVTQYAQTKELEIQEFEYDGGTYRGEALNGKPHGMGRIIYYNNSIDPRMEYRGYFINGKRQGKGFMYWRNGDQYAGNWENGMENGEGECIYANGDKYVGHWENGLWNGKGCYSHDGHDSNLVWKSSIAWNSLGIEGRDDAGNIHVMILFEKDKTGNIGDTELNRSVMRTFKKFVNKSTRDN